MIERTQALFEEIESYLRQEMDPASQSAFEERMSMDEDLQVEVEKHRLLYNKFKDPGLLEFRKLLEKVNNDQKSRQPLGKQIKFSLVGTAAAILVLAAGIYFVWPSLTPETGPSDLYAQYYQSYPPEVTKRGSNPSEEVRQTLSLYSEQQYAESIKGLEEMVRNFPGNDRYKLYLASSYLNSNYVDKAIYLLKEISEGSKYWEDVQWYLALAYIKSNELENAKTTLEKVVLFNGVRAKDAMDLSAQL